MPAALERKLKRQAAKDPDIKDKDAYVYGTLRKTGWKPSTQKKKSKKMSATNDRVIRLSKGLDAIINFQYDDNDRRRSTLGTAALIGGGAAAGAGGLLAHQAITRTGGYGANWAGAKTAYGLERRGIGAYVNTPVGNVPRTPLVDGTGSIGYKIGSIFGAPGTAAKEAATAAGTGVRNVTAPAVTATRTAATNVGTTASGLASRFGGAVKSGAQSAVDYAQRAGAAVGGAAQQAGGAIGGAAKSAWGGIQRGAGAAASGVEAAGRTIGKYGAQGGKAVMNLIRKLKFFDAQGNLIQFNEAILEPFAHTEDSKLYEEHFGAGLSPAAALRMPFPTLMRLLKQRNILQQQFPGFSSKMGRLVELDSKVDGIINFEYEYEDDDADRQRKRLGPWTAGAAVAGAGGAGYAGYHYRKPISEAVGRTYAGAKDVTARAYAGAKEAAGRFEREAGRQITGRYAAGRTAILKSLGRKTPRGSFWKAPYEVARAGYKGARYAKLSAQLDQVIEFAYGYEAIPISGEKTPFGEHLVYRPVKKKGVGQHFQRAAGKYTATAAGLGAAAAIAHHDARRLGLSTADILINHPGAIIGLGGTGLLAGSVADQIRARKGIMKSIQARRDKDVEAVRRSNP